MMTPEILFLVGLPGTGKTTFAKNYIIRNSRFSIISRDNQIMKYSNLYDITYKESFQIYHQEIEKDLLMRFNKYINNNISFIMDMTNLTRSSRLRWLTNTPGRYKKSCIIFDNQMSERIKVSDDVMKHMRNIYEEPANQEGFDFIKKT